MNKNLPITDELLGKFLAQETDADELAVVEDWLQASSENQKELADYQYIWEQTSVVKNPETNLDVDAAWLKVRSKMTAEKETRTVALFPKKRRYFTKFNIAASIAFFAGIGLLFLLLTNKNAERISLKTTNNTLEKTLPDGSVVFLNTNTILSYSADFQGDTREITLVGEAFFDVQRNESKPFVIHANGSDVRVLGTSFNVKAYTKNVKVSVESGKVSFKNEAKETFLVRGEEAEFEARNDTIRKITLDKNVFAYKTKVFRFENSSLEHVIKILSENYRTKIILKNNQIKICRLTTTLNNETLPNALNIIAETLNLSVSPEGEKYIIDGKGCNE